MKIRALANGNVIEADDGAAKILIEAGIYEAVNEGEEVRTADAAPLETRPAKRVRRARG